MNDTVTKLLELADTYAEAVTYRSEAAQISTRQALQDELVRLFTPLTDERIMKAFCAKPHSTQYVGVFFAGVRWAQQMHGITGEKQ